MLDMGNNDLTAQDAQRRAERLAGPHGYPPREEERRGWAPYQRPGMYTSYAALVCALWVALLAAVPVVLLGIVIVHAVHP